MDLNLNQVELENNQFYTSRSLRPSCDTGGVVYESKRKYDSYSFNLSKEFPRLIDPHNHFEDDKFNESEMNFNFKQFYENHSIGVDLNHNEVRHYESFSSYENTTLGFPSIKYESYKNVIIEDKLLVNPETSIPPNTKIYQEKSNHSYFYASHMYERQISLHGVEEDKSTYSDSAVSQSTFDSGFNYDNSPPPLTIIEANKTQGRSKRKQVYNIENNSPPKFFDDTEDLKKMYNEKYLQQLNQENITLTKVKLVSVLKKNRSKPKKNKTTKPSQKSMSSKLENDSFSSANLTQNTSLESCDAVNLTPNTSMESCNDVNLTPNTSMESCNAESSVEISLVEKKDYLDNSMNILGPLDLDTTMDSEFSNADYFDYIQPRERIIESDMEKLVSPIVMEEFSEIEQSSQVDNFEIKKSDSIDYNYNQVDCENFEKSSDEESHLTPFQLAEKNLFEQQAQAKQLGLINYFETSNDSVSNEVLQALLHSTIILSDDLFKYNFYETVEINSGCNQFLKLPFEPTPYPLFGNAYISNMMNKVENFSMQQDSKSTPEEKVHLKNDKIMNLDFPSSSKKVCNQMECSNGLSLLNKFNSQLSAEFKPKLSENLKKFYINNKPPGELIIKIKRIDEVNNKYMIEKKAVKNIEG